MNLEQYIRDIPDFPKKGILFKDITPLLGNKKALIYSLDALYDLVNGEKIDKVVGTEARGFFFAMLLAQKLGAGFVPVRKPGKLPYHTFGASYELEYGTDRLEMHQDAIREGERVLIHDDVLATGGTAKAVCELVGQTGGIITQCNFLIELSFLNGRDKLAGYETKSLLKY
jgi:adenine phosphoribosyltransferase